MLLRTIGQKADIIGTYRAISVFAMETLARWTPLTPELEVKVLFGRHLWEFAQHADALGQRGSELRAGLHYTRPPLPAFQAALDRYASATSTGERIEGTYDAFIPELVRRYSAFRAEADPLLDQPTVRILDRILADLPRLCDERHALLADITPPVASAGWVESVGRGLAAPDEFVDFRPSKEAAAV
jgi:hypothetical protein